MRRNVKGNWFGDPKDCFLGKQHCNLGAAHLLWYISSSKYLITTSLLLLSILGLSGEGSIWEFLSNTLKEVWMNTFVTCVIQHLLSKNSKNTCLFCNSIWLMICYSVTSFIFFYSIFESFLFLSWSRHNVVITSINCNYL